MVDAFFINAAIAVNHALTAVSVRGNRRVANQTGRAIAVAVAPLDAFAIEANMPRFAIA